MSLEIESVLTLMHKSRGSFIKKLHVHVHPSQAQATSDAFLVLGTPRAVIHEADWTGIHFLGSKL